jgi:Zn-dependent protease/CBS domain-containing protein
MFGRRITLFSLFGFEVRIDISWFILAVLVTWSLAVGLFPFYFEGLTTEQYWLMGIAGAVGLFLSIVFHEMSHSLVARRYGIHMKGITLFIFGGVAEMDEEPPSARAEFSMAVAGPISSVVIAGIFYGFHLLGRRAGWPVPVTGVLSYLAFINLILAVFNMLPAFPLDGGRILRSALWGWKGDLRWATRIGSQLGSGFGWGLIFLGAWSVLIGNFIAGVWWFLIGMFLKNAAAMSYRQLIMREMLGGEKVSRFMSRSPVTVPPSVTLRGFVEDYVYRHHHKMFPVVEDSRIHGCAGVREIKEIPQGEWEQRTVGDIARPCSGENTIDPDDDALKALSVMNRTGNSRLMVVDDGKLVGIIAIKDMMRFFSLKMDLEEEQRERV